MRIISKYKDFYDYIVQDYDADLHYVREPKYFSTNDKNNIATKITKLINDGFKPFNSYIYNRNYYGTVSKETSGHISITSITFGIYPFVYKVPVIRVANPTYYSYVNGMYYIMSKTVADKILESSKEDGLKILVDEVKRLTKDVNWGENPKFEVYKYTDIRSDIRKNACKADIKEVFYELEAPVFVRSDISYLFENTPYMDAMSDCSYVSNICFNELNMNILKYFYGELADLNTYINIENFLWSVKQEPNANPDNKTKIQAHGFDLKTSFRKM